MDAKTPTFILEEESRRFQARSPLLKRHWAMRLDLAPGIAFQPETHESVEDQIAETLWAEGIAVKDADPEMLREVRASFAVLTPGRQRDGFILPATLLLGFPASEREEAFRILQGFPEQLHLELSDGSRIKPEVDGGAGSSGRLPAVLALRYRVPVGAAPVGLVSTRSGAPGAWPAPEAWAHWTEHLIAAPAH